MMESKNISLILASQSPRRAELLVSAGFQFIVIEPDPETEEQAEKNYPPQQLVIELARRKAENVVSRILNGDIGNQRLQTRPNSTRERANRFVVLAADTVALCDEMVLGKPVDRDDAFRMLRQMSGRQHQVLTGVCLWDVASNRNLDRLSVTQLKMDELSDSQLNRFLNKNDWQGKAGGFGYQDGLEWLHILDGLESNVVGLPVESLQRWIEELYTA